LESDKSETLSLIEKDVYERKRAQRGSERVLIQYGETVRTRN